MAGAARRPSSKPPPHVVPAAGVPLRSAAINDLSAQLRRARLAAFLGRPGLPHDENDELGALVARTARLYAASVSPNTRKDYARRWRKWEAWCRSNGLEPLGAPPEVVMMFLADAIGAGEAALGTLRSYMAAINRIQVEAGQPPPGGDPAMTMFLRTMRRVVEPRTPQGEISALKIGPLREVCRYLDGRRMDPVQVRDKALLAMTRAGIGDSDQVRLTWDDVRLDERSVTLLVRAIRSGRKDRTVRIARARDSAVCGVLAIREWRRIGGTEVPWVITQTNRTGAREPGPWDSRDIYRIRRARLDSLGAGGQRATARDRSGRDRGHPDRARPERVTGSIGGKSGGPATTRGLWDANESAGGS